MKPSTLALPTLLFSTYSTTFAFTQPALLKPNPTGSIFSPSTSHIFPSISSSKTFLSAYLGQDFNSPPSFANNNSGSNGNDDLDESKYVQKLSPDERRENLDVMKQIFKFDLADLQRRRDYAGWVEAKKDLKKRQANDPWFELNDMIKEAVQMDEMERAAKVKILIDKVGGPPPGVTQKREYAMVTEIYSSSMSLSRAEGIAKIEQSKKNKEIWKRMIAEREANELKEEEEYWNDPLKEEKDAKARRERSMSKIYGELEEKRKKMEARAAEIQEKYKDLMKEEMLNNPLDRAIAETKEVLEKKQIQKGKETLESSSATSSQITYSESGRPRIPGDRDVALGEIDESKVFESSDTTTDILRVQVDSSYNPSDSDPPARKHCFKYSIQIMNLSSTQTIQLTSRKFQIQTVGTSKKDIVQGEGVTGSQPILKPGEKFEYTSTAPLSVRPLGTTIVAARMKGSYKYKILGGNNNEEEKEAELGTFHFVFPLSQRVQPCKNEDEDVDEQDEDMSNYI